MIGTQGGPYLDAGDWQLNLGYRYQRSDRHFRGAEEERNRQAEHSEVINDIHLLDFGVTRAISPRISISASLPVLIGTRTTPLRDQNRTVFDRDTQRTEAIGDLVIDASAWIFDPEELPPGNIQLRLGAKFPTGQTDVRHQAAVQRNGQYVSEERTVDQSLQPGDGGFGAVVGLQGFYTLLDEYTLFAQGSYLINPRDTNGVPTFRSGSGEEVMSVPDAYLAKIGVARAIPFLEDLGLSFSLALRIEGVPVRDLVGDSNGFRRPGFAASVEPGIAWSRGGHTFGLSAPLAFHRERQRSVPDRHANPPRHGDAAFADFLVLFSYTYRIGATKPAPGSEEPAFSFDSLVR